MKITFKRSLDIMYHNGEVTDMLVDGCAVDNDTFNLLLPWAEDEIERQAAWMEKTQRHNRIAGEIVGFAVSMAMTQGGQL